MDRAEAIRALRALAAALDATIAEAGGDGDSCLRMIQRIQAVQTQLQRVQDGLLAYHLQNCLDAIRQGEQNEADSLQGIHDAYCRRRRCTP